MTVSHAAASRDAPSNHTSRGNSTPCSLSGDRAEPERMSHPDDITQPLDHLPPLEERDKAIEIDEPSYPTSAPPTGKAHASPETAAEPGMPNRHGVDKLPPTSR